MNATIKTFAALSAILVGGCGGREEVKAPPPLKPLSAAVGTATVRGRVTFVGTPPVMKILDVKCHPGARPISDESAVLSAEGGLANAFVYLEGGPVVDGSGLPPKVLDQVDCRYAPHVIGVVLNQTLTVRSDDPVFHNVHYDPANNPAANLTFDTKGQTRTVRFAHPDIFHARCDVHPWMSGYIGVFANPLFTVTGAGGGFSIKDVPAGSYTLVLWHERYGVEKRPITVAEGKTLDLKLEYAPADKAAK